MSYFVVEEGRITLNVYNIPINFGLFNNLEKPFALEPPDPPSVSNILNVSNKPTYSSYIPSTDSCKLSHLVKLIHHLFYLFNNIFMFAVRQCLHIMHFMCCF